MEKSDTTNHDKKGAERSEIAYQNKDVTSKVMAEEFKGKSFEAYGIKVPKIVSVEPTNLPAIEANELRMDNLFLLEDGSYAIVDYESEYKSENNLKYLGYVVRASKRLYNTHGRYPRIRMIVIYTADVQRGTTHPDLDMGSLQFCLTEAFLSELDSRKIWTSVSSKVEMEVDISEDEMMQLIIYPLSFKKREEKQDAIKRVVEVAEKISDGRKTVFILKCLMVFSDKIIREEDARKIKEVLMMTKVERLMREDITEDVTKKVTESVTKEITASVTKEITASVTKEVTENVTRSIAKKMLAKGDDIDTVSECTNLSKDIVIQLVEDIAKEKE